MDTDNCRKCGGVQSLSVSTGSEAEDNYEICNNCGYYKKTIYIETQLSLKEVNEMREEEGKEPKKILPKLKLYNVEIKKYLKEIEL